MRPVIGPVCVYVALCALAAAQELESSLADEFRSPGWNYGVQVAGGASVVPVASSFYETAGHTTSNLALSLRAGRVLTYEHGSGWRRGTFEVDMSVIPMELFFVLGTHYAGGFEAPTLRWNFTHDHRHIVPFAGASFGMLFSPENFPPGDTKQFNFTAAVDLGAHVLVRRGESVDTTIRISHLSNAYLGAQNPGVPVALQLTLGYTWHKR